MATILVSVLSLALKVANAAIWVYVILSWIIPRNPSQQLINLYTTLAKFIEPVLAPIRKLMQPLTYRIGLDFSPYALAILLSWVSRFLSRIIYTIF